MNLPPTTPSPQQRVLNRARTIFSGRRSRSDNSTDNSSSGGAKNGPFIGAMLRPKRPKRPKITDSPFVIMGRHVTRLEQEHSEKQSADSKRAKELEMDNKILREMMAQMTLAHAQTILDLQKQHKMEKDRMTAALQQFAGMDEPPVFMHVSYHRLCQDQKFWALCRGVTPFPDPVAVELWWNVCMAVTGGTLPIRFRSLEAKTTMTQSTTTIDDHKNYMFFALFVMRTGIPSFAICALMFGFERTRAIRWYVTWLRTLKLIVARLFPQPTREILLAKP